MLPKIFPFHRHPYYVTFHLALISSRPTIYLKGILSNILLSIQSIRIGNNKEEKKEKRGKK